ncbi:hypothetical protein GPECTOR_63g41 [Gonium pectorale]|uniref:Uncharacterized protein n=1 Tax=Gonium pectorale TaxID=33097 RepID=A0A150G5A1_GONPE|nr:hypothetical protein GPECTOR_63g41 [Gonium pectorale]|eukprot:KXZ44715.1 hypothetical protein GPECTOR_63g41 [Gonium pectorale]
MHARQPSAADSYDGASRDEPYPYGGMDPAAAAGSVAGANSVGGGGVGLPPGRRAPAALAGAMSDPAPAALRGPGAAAGAASRYLLAAAAYPPPASPPPASSAACSVTFSPGPSRTTTAGTAVSNRTISAGTPVATAWLHHAHSPYVGPVGPSHGGGPGPGTGTGTGAGARDSSYGGSPEPNAGPGGALPGLQERDSLHSQAGTTSIEEAR